MLKTYGYIATHTHDNALLVEQDVKLLNESNRVLGFESESSK